MKIDIWSDVMCPFCYIGKRRLEGALADFPHKDDVEIEWHSFQLDPALQHEPGKDLYTYLAERKGMSHERSELIHNQLTATAKADGLTYNFDKAVVVNSFDAHRLIQLAKKHGLGDAIEEKLFKAYFTEGKNISNHNTLMQIGMEAGLRAVEIGEMLNSDAFADKVHADITTAETYGIRGVPFFVFNNKYGISGAQPREVFADGLQQAWFEFELADAGSNGDICSADGVCEVKNN